MVRVLRRTPARCTQPVLLRRLSLRCVLRPIAAPKPPAPPPPLVRLGPGGDYTWDWFMQPTQRGNG